MAMSKKFNDGAMPANCDVIIIFLIYSQCGASQARFQMHGLQSLHFN